MKDFNSQFKLALKGAKEDPVHDMRVLIKRLNAVFIFLNESRIYKSQSRRYLNQLKYFFKSAGNLRDIQIHLTLLNKYKKASETNFSEYEEYLRSKEGIARQNFFNVSAKYPKREQIYVKDEIINSVRDFSQKKLSKRTDEFIFTRLKDLENYLFHADTYAYLHKIRQTLKELRFFIEIVKNCSEKSPMKDVDFQEIKEIENVLGSWNDCFVFIEDLNRYGRYKKMMTSKLPGEINRLIQIVEADMNSMVEELKPRLLKLIYNLKYFML